MLLIHHLFFTNENHCTVNDVHNVCQLNRLPLTKTIHSKSANLIVCHPYKICISNLTGNLSVRFFFSMLSLPLYEWVLFTIDNELSEFNILHDKFDGISENNMEIAILSILMTDYTNDPIHVNDIMEHSTDSRFSSIYFTFDLLSCRSQPQAKCFQN